MSNPLFTKKTKIYLFSSVLLISIGVSHAVQVPIIDKSKIPTNIEVDVKVDIPPKYGREPSEYFITPIAGITYTDNTQINQSFYINESDARGFNPNGSNNGAMNVNRTEIGGVFGILFDGQYQIMATDYWRAGFQTGIIYTSPTESEFIGSVCEPVNCNTPDGPTDPFNEKGKLKTSSWQLPVLFTFSRYAQEDDYIATLKLGPTISVQMYDSSFEGFRLEPESETQIGLALGIDGRLRVGDTDTFLLAGFLFTGLFGGNTNNGFSGVDQVNNFSVYLGYSFS